MNIKEEKSTRQKDAWEVLIATIHEDGFMDIQVGYAIIGIASLIMNSVKNETKRNRQRPMQRLNND